MEWKVLSMIYQSLSSMKSVTQQIKTMIKFHWGLRETSRYTHSRGIKNAWYACIEREMKMTTFHFLSRFYSSVTVPRNSKIITCSSLFPLKSKQLVSFRTHTFYQVQKWFCNPHVVLSKELGYQFDWHLTTSIGRNIMKYQSKNW